MGHEQFVNLDLSPLLRGGQLLHLLFGPLLRVGESVHPFFGPLLRVSQPPDRGGQLGKVFPTHEVSFDLHRRLREHLRLMVVERLPIVRRHVCDTDHFILLSADSSGAATTFCHGQKGRM